MAPHVFSCCGASQCRWHMTKSKMTAFAYRVTAAVLLIILGFLVLRQCYKAMKSVDVRYPLDHVNMKEKFRSHGIYFKQRIDKKSEKTMAPEVIGMTAKVTDPPDTVSYPLDTVSSPPVSVPEIQQRLPDVLLIGVMKCGTGKPWCQDIETLSVLLAACEGNLPVY